MLDTLYAAAARRRREWYAARPDLRRRLRRPVISIGNIAVGGRGKTPLTALVAQLLLEMGERPAILSRGYKRSDPQDGAVVVRDAGGVRADLGRSGDEPMMLARQLPGAIVITSPDRYLGGRLAELHLGATVHLLDDGFQHFQLDRDADIVVVAREDLSGRTLPSGRLREPADVLIAADALVSFDPIERPVAPDAVFSATRHVGAPRFEDGRGDADARPEGRAYSDVRPDSDARHRVYVISGIAHPEHFVAAVRSHGLTVVGERAFTDHHPYSARDLERVVTEARSAGADAIVTTEKDFVRLLPHRPFALPVGYLPLTIEVEPREEFRAWLRTSLATARDQILV
jgi:tetraacyldisaccharide 4'-kinase